MFHNKTGIRSESLPDRLTPNADHKTFILGENSVKHKDEEGSTTRILDGSKIKRSKKSTSTPVGLSDTEDPFQEKLFDLEKKKRQTRISEREE